MTYALISVGSLLVGAFLGWLSGRREFHAYKQGVEANRGGSCWIRQQLPSHADD